MTPGQLTKPRQTSTRNWIAAALTFASFMVSAQELSSIAIDTDKDLTLLELNTGEATQVQFKQSEQPPRLTIDLTNTRNLLGWRSRVFNTGAIEAITSGESNQTTRLVVDLRYPVNLEQQSSIRGVTLSLRRLPPPPAAVVEEPVVTATELQSLQFERTQGSTGRLKLQLSASGVIIDVRKQNNQLQLILQNVISAKGLAVPKKINELNTPVKRISQHQQDDGMVIEIDSADKFEHSVYQTDKLITVDIRPLEKPLPQATPEGYLGKKLSLNYEKIELRSALQLIADFSGQNFVISDGVKGAISLRLNNIPWDQALDLILKTKGLAKRRYGDTLLIAPQAELADAEEVELRNYKQLAQLRPLHSELIRIKYAKAEHLAKLLKSRDNSLLSSRGNISVDQRTNSLLIRDSFDHLQDLRTLVTQLDIPVQQVMIESRVVIAEDTFVRDLGARIGVRSIQNQGAGSSFVAGNASALGNNLNTSNFGKDMAVNLPASPSSGASAATIALGFLNADSLLDLELSALQAEGRGDVVSNPRIVTSNQQRAVIEQGVELPYQESTSSGATATAFRKAVMSLAVTPQITPDNQVILDLVVNKDSRGEDLDAGVAINTRELQTQVLVNDGETVVLGGIYETEKSKVVTKVPFLGDIPLLGALFRSTTEINNKNELLVFVTPKILVPQAQQ